MLLKLGGLALVAEQKPLPYAKEFDRMLCKQVNAALCHAPFAACAGDLSRHADLYEISRIRINGVS